jgi:hypothetical protein
MVLREDCAIGPHSALSLCLIRIFQKPVLRLNLNQSDDHYSCDTHHHCDGDKHIQQIGHWNVIKIVLQMVPPYLNCAELFADAIRAPPIPGVSALHPIPGTQLPLPAASAHIASPTMQCRSKAHAVWAS